MKPRHLTLKGDDKSSVSTTIPPSISNSYFYNMYNYKDIKLFAWPSNSFQFKVISGSVSTRQMILYRMTFENSYEFHLNQMPNSYGIITFLSYDSRPLLLPFCAFSSATFCARKRWSRMYIISPPRLRKSNGSVFTDIFLEFIIFPPWLQKCRQ